ncbi:hypothetical protein BGZ63DRAFT_382799 [Mariannaea sp. PMI_226]|nr:hypothetical protein BGZ63DRAFT_382799 [Mariannaea sp. PMI_226]
MHHLPSRIPGKWEVHKARTDQLLSPNARSTLKTYYSPSPLEAHIGGGNVCPV